MANPLQTDTIQNSATTGGPDFPNGASGFKFPSDAVNNLGLSVSFNSGAMTINLTQADGATNPSTGTGAVTVGIRSATLSSGSFNQRTVTAATSVTVSNGSALGIVSGPVNLFVYAIDNAGTIELAVSGRLFREDTLMTTSPLIGNGGTANSFTTAWSNIARTSVPFRLIGKILTGISTPGTWRSVDLTQIQVAPLALFKPPTYQTFTSGSGTYVLPAGCTGIRVFMTGGGGGGAGSGTAAGTIAVAGNNTTFGSMTANGGALGPWNNTGSGSGGAGGSFTLSGAVGFGANGNYGGQYYGLTASAGTYEMIGGFGGGSPLFGGQTAPSTYNSAGLNAPANTGAGGSGGGANNVTSSSPGSGGGGGGFINAVIEGSNLAQNFSYGVGSGGNGGGAGTSGLAGGAGGSGIIVVEEYYG